ncbi:MAG: ABC-F family ATP-binding cassette domain-containing protein [Lachnospiraceae bacterium]|nr:ABC-F family ATP-binding cassette domain-containing protein [Candidatus Colinaster equi]
MILSVNNISKTFTNKNVLNDASFFLNEHDKAALIGINGCGKTTLINIIMEKLSADSGTVTISKDTTVGYLPQNAIVESDNTIYDEVIAVKADLLKAEEKLREMEMLMGEYKGEQLNDLMNEYHLKSEQFERAGGNMIMSEVYGTLKGLGFDESDFNTPVKILSGGQKTRVALAKLLVGRPDIIILDEPTNHLDMSSILWLETYLLNYSGTVLIVSHDRFFLDKIVNKVIELSGGHLNTYTGNYTDYAAKKAIQRVSELNAYLKNVRDIKHQQEVIDKLRSFNREKSIKRADSRQKMLDKMEVVEKPEEINDQMQIVLVPRIESGNDVLSIEGLTKSYSNTLFDNIDIFLRKGEHVAIIGDNGTGKTTILKIINELVTPDSGKIKLGANVTIGYYDQEHHVLHDEKTIFDEISDEYPTLTNTEIRNVLAAFLFTNDDVFKKISSLSGGEKGRVSLAKLMLSEANLLILDEPTNHLDITSKEILENALNNYEGTVLYVSHDRYFINKTADRILELKDQKLFEYLGNYDYYLEKSDELNKQSSDTVDNIESVPHTTQKSSAAVDYKAQKLAAAAAKRAAKELSDVENEIEKCENLLSDIEAALNNPANGNDTAKLISLQKDKEKYNELLEELMTKWEQLSEDM